MRVLVAFPTFPQVDTNSGDLRMFEVLRILLDEGHRVTFLARWETDPRYRRDAEHIGAECVSDAEGHFASSSLAFRRFLQGHMFDGAILAFPFIYSTYAPYIRAFLPKCRLIYDTVDLHFLRLEREAALTVGRAVHEEAPVLTRQEAWAMGDADTVWVVTQAEADITKHTFGSDLIVRVVPNVHRAAACTAGYELREGVVFLGGYGHRPNVDAVDHFMLNIFPLVRRALPDVPLTIAGSHPPPGFSQYERAYPRVSVTGFVPDHRELLTQHRVGIAPLRYGAGMKGKVGEYLACGLPTVTTPIGAEGMGLRHGEEILIESSPEDFASAIVRLYRDPDLWGRLAGGGREHIERHFSPTAVASLVANGLASPLARSRRPSWESAIGHLRRLSSIGELFRVASRSIEVLRAGGAGEFRARLAAWTRRESIASQPAKREP